MSTGFFKDITGGNNKFVPRSFQFNLGHNDLTPKDSPDSSVISKSSTAPTKDFSTAPSTGTSSKHFHSNSSTDSEPVTAAGGKPIATYLLDELSLESITEEPQPSGVKRLDMTKSAQPVDEEDDLEITEIREATADPDSSKIQEISTYTGSGQPSEQTSSDLLLEALYKSQKVCTSLKRNLEDANVKISLQEEQIESNKRNFETMKTNFKNFKTNLYLIEKNTKDLVDSKAAESNRIKEFKTEHQAVVDSVKAFKEEISGLRKKVEGLKQLKNATSFEIERRNKDINTLQKKLDETSGFLSEQKIRTLQLEKILEESRKSYDAKMEKVNEHTTKFQEQLMKSIRDSDSSIGSKINALFENEMKPLLGTVSSDIFAKVNDLGENFTKALTLTDKSLSEQVTGSVNIIREGFKDSRKSNELLESKLGTIVNNQESVNVTLQTIIKKCEEVIDNTGSIPPGCNDELSSLSEQLELLKSQIQIQTDETKRCDTLNEKLTTLSKELTDSLATIKQLDTIVNERNKQIGELKANSEELTLRETELAEKVKSLESAILTKDSTFKDSEEKFLRSKSVIESKLKTQMEIYRMVAQERDDVKALLEATKLDLTKTLETQASTIEELKGEKERLKEEAAQAKEEIQQLKSEVVALEGRNVTLTYNLEQQAKELEARPIIKHYIERSKSKEPEPFLDKMDDIIDSTPTPKSGPKCRPTILDEPSTSNKATAKLVKAAKPPPVSKAKTRTKSTAPPPSSAALSKRKKLLDDDEDMSFIIFDKFDLDTISDEVPTLPKKYTKRKKTKV